MTEEIHLTVDELLEALATPPEPIDADIDDATTELLKSAVQCIWRCVHINRDRSATLKPKTPKADAINELVKRNVYNTLMAALVIANTTEEVVHEASGGHLQSTSE